MAEHRLAAAYRDCKNFGSEREIKLTDLNRRIPWFGA